MSVSTHLQKPIDTTALGGLVLITAVIIASILEFAASREGSLSVESGL